MMPVAHPSLLALLARRAQSSAVSDSASNDSMNNNKHNTQSVLDAASALASLAALPPPPLVRRGSSSTTPSSPSSSSFIEFFSRSPNDRTPSPDCGEKGVCAAVSPTYSSSHGSPNATVYNAAGTAGSTAGEKKKELMKNSHSKKFPQKLMDIISDPSNTDVISWLPHGRSFYVISSERLSRDVLPAHFFRGGVRPHGSGGGMPRQFSSFVRRLYRWGFKLISRGPDADSFYHPLFRRDDPKLCRKISSCARKEVRDGCPEMHQGIVGCSTPSSHGSIGRDSPRAAEKNESATKKKKDNDERQLHSPLLERNDPTTTATKKITEIGASNNEQCAVSEERVQALREQVLIKESILKAKKMRLQRLQYECERLSREATTRQMTHSAAVNAAPAKLHELSMPKNSDSGGNQCEMVGTHNISSFDNCHIDEHSQGLPSSPVLVSTSTLENLYDGDNRRILALRNKMNAAWRESSPPTTAVALPFLRSQVYCTISPGADFGSSSSKLLKRASHYNPFTSQEAEILKRAIEVLERDGC
uniref:HSF-type DNA-binding domain-containing protein n=1 Tax=Pseudictyota dubia TaxID=2749911 RepID=A0A7R9W3F2_9STRA|mmetsp:Transcript_29551/g.54867  ORF Transcript_29551/g.54867 Transcript_29551/m.54867 type:complete len:532 (+) Transcript_29551:551-2146(+)